jgi:hypothetical protein
VRKASTVDKAARGDGTVVSLPVQIRVSIASVLFLASVWLHIADLFVADVLWGMLVVSADLVLERAGIGEANALASLVKEGQET